MDAAAETVVRIGQAGLRGIALTHHQFCIITHGNSFIFRIYLIRHEDVAAKNNSAHINFHAASRPPPMISIKILTISKNVFILIPNNLNENQYINHQISPSQNGHYSHHQPNRLSQPTLGQ